MDARKTWFVALVASVPHVGQAQELPGVLDSVGTLHLEETDAALIARPRARADRDGGWLYWDRQAGDVRLFSPDGSLLKAFGAPGQGPGEFDGIVGAVRIARGHIVAIDGGGRISVWSEAGDELIATFASGLPHPHGISAVGNDVAVLAAPQLTGGHFGDAPVLHRVSVERQALVASTLSLPLTPSNVTAALSTESPEPVVRGANVYVAVAPFDSLWVVAAEGWNVIGRIPIPPESLQDSPPPVSSEAGRDAYRSWVLGASFPGRFFSMPDGGWVMQTWGLRREGPSRGIVRFDNRGVRVWEVADTPELLAVNPSSGELYLWDPEGLDPAEVQVVRERPRDAP